MTNHLLIFKFIFRNITIGFLVIFSSGFLLAESKSQSEIRIERKFQVAGFKIGNRYSSILFSYNLSKSITIGVDIRHTNYDRKISSTHYSDHSKTKINDAYFFLQWFPFNAGGLFLSVRAGYYKLTLEESFWILNSNSYSDFKYEFYSLNISKPMYGSGIGYRWIFENGISIGIEAVAFKQYRLPLKQYEFMVDSSKQITIADYWLSNWNIPNYIGKPTSLFFSIGYNF